MDRVFPLLCPVQEALGLPGWSAQILHSDSGVAELGCVFRTRAERGEPTGKAIKSSLIPAPSAPP